jgi:uncharacterized surface protein with fasciclin (FAS1) repeats
MTNVRYPAAAAVAAFFLSPTFGLAQTPTPSEAPAPMAIPASPNVVAQGDMVSTLQASGHFTILVKALDAANLSATLKATPQLTLFAPTDEAFNALPPSELAALMNPKNVQTLQQVLVYHLVHLNLDTSKIKGAKGPVETVEKGKIEVDGSNDVLKVNNADIIQADIKVANGNIIQVVDKVLIPTDITIPTAAAGPSAEMKAGG